MNARSTVGKIADVLGVSSQAESLCQNSDKAKLAVKKMPVNRFRRAFSNFATSGKIAKRKDSIATSATGGKSSKLKGAVTTSATGGKSSKPKDSVGLAVAKATTESFQGKEKVVTPGKLSEIPHPVKKAPFQNPANS